MTFLEVMALAVLQGLTEFLPVSSSGHLVLAQSFFGAASLDSLPFIVLVHLATALAAVVFYRDEVLGLAASILHPSGRPAAETRRSRQIILMLVVATIPTALMGLTFRSTFESLFHEPQRVAFSLFITGAVLMAASRCPEGRTGLVDMGWREALLIGLAQGAAIVPGISRSGSTIAAGLFLGLKRAETVRFSFLLLLPATLGAAVIESHRLASLGRADLVQSAVGFFSAALVGYASIYLVLRWTGSGRLWYFSIYCWLAAAAAAAAGWLG